MMPFLHKLDLDDEIMKQPYESDECDVKLVDILICIICLIAFLYYIYMYDDLQIEYEMQEKLKKYFLYTIK